MKFPPDRKTFEDKVKYIFHKIWRASPLLPEEFEMLSSALEQLIKERDNANYHARKEAEYKLRENIRQLRTQIDLALWKEITENLERALR